MHCLWEEVKEWVTHFGKLHPSQHSFLCLVHCPLNIKKTTN